MGVVPKKQTQTDAMTAYGNALLLAMQATLFSMTQRQGPNKLTNRAQQLLAHWTLHVKIHFHEAQYKRARVQNMSDVARQAHKGIYRTRHTFVMFTEDNGNDHC